jgi:lysine 2,3-aminomutase
METELLVEKESNSFTQPSFEHWDLRDDDFWSQIPAYQDIHSNEFHDHLFQTKNAVTTVQQLREVLVDRVGESFYSDLDSGIKRAPMALRITPYLISLIDWDNVYDDPIRKQFLPLASQQISDHPLLALDSLGERRDSPVPGLTHRYPDKALFLALDSCPVYCRFCTRSYAIGHDTEEVHKIKLTANLRRWEAMFDYIKSRPELEDIVISGGDTYNLKAEHIRLIGERLLNMSNIRRIRYATKGLAVMPQKILSDSHWFDAISHVVDLGRKLHKDVVVHTHFNHSNEITGITQKAMNRFAERGITVRCQTVLQRGVNDSAKTMQLLVRRLSYINIHPYYVYFHDMVPGVEDLRTSLSSGLEIEKHVRGFTAGFNTPAFVVDTMGGGGKRDAHSYEYYDRESGIAVFTSPAIRPGKLFTYFDPIASLDEYHQELWKDPVLRQKLLDDTLEIVLANELLSTGK